MVRWSAWGRCCCRGTLICIGQSSYPISFEEDEDVEAVTKNTFVVALFQFAGKKGENADPRSNE